MITCYHSLLLLGDDCGVLSLMLLLWLHGAYILRSNDLSIIICSSANSIFLMSSVFSCSSLVCCSSRAITSCFLRCLYFNAAILSCSLLRCFCLLATDEHDEGDARLVAMVMSLVTCSPGLWITSTLSPLG